MTDALALKVSGMSSSPGKTTHTQMIGRSAGRLDQGRPTKPITCKNYVRTAKNRRQSLLTDSAHTTVDRPRVVFPRHESTASASVAAVLATPHR